MEVYEDRHAVRLVAASPDRAANYSHFNRFKELTGVVEVAMSIC